MHATKHLRASMSQRGIKGEMIELALEHGEIDGDRYVLSRKIIHQLIEEMKHEQKLLEHAAKKGGITVATEGDVLVTTFRANSYSAAKAQNNRH